MYTRALEHLVLHWKKYGVLALFVALIVSALASYSLWGSMQDLRAQISTKNLIIEAKEQKLQDFDSKLGISESNLREQSALNSKYENSIREFKRELESKTEQLSLRDFELKSREETIAALKGEATGGSTIVLINGEDSAESVLSEVGRTISYAWTDILGRFKLKDPDILTKDDEIFTYNQRFRITGLVLSDSSGAVQVSKVSVEEIVLVERDGVFSYEKVEGGDVELVESNFEYALLEDQPKSFDWLAPITLRPLVGMNFPYFTPFIGVELVNLGRWVPYANIGVVPSVAFDVSGLPRGDFETLQRSRVGVGLVYHLIPPLLETNLGVAVTLSTPMNNLSTPMLSIDLVVYLTEDLFPL